MLIALLLFGVGGFATLAASGRIAFLAKRQIKSANDRARRAVWEAERRASEERSREAWRLHQERTRPEREAYARAEAARKAEPIPLADYERAAVLGWFRDLGWAESEKRAHGAFPEPGKLKEALRIIVRAAQWAWCLDTTSSTPEHPRRAAAAECVAEWEAERVSGRAQTLTQRCS